MSKLKPPGDKRSTGRQKLEEVIGRCRAIEERGLNPFMLEMDSVISIIQKYFPSWENPDELILDAEAVNGLATVIRLQSEWLQRRSSSLYMDPLIVERRLKELSREELALVFASAWRPVLELEALTGESLKDAREYWLSLPTLADRWPLLARDGSPAGSMNRREFIRSRLLDKETFESRLESLYQELRKKTGNERISYWDFVTVDSFDETVERSYLASFLVSYGWATLHVHPIEGEISIQILKKPSDIKPSRRPTSIVLTISREDWERRRGKS